MKVTDIYFFITAVSIPEWPDNIHNALTIGLYFTLLRYQPWDWSQIQFMGQLGRMLPALYRTDAEGGRDILRQFWCACDWIATMTLGLVRTLLSAENWTKLLSV